MAEYISHVRKSEELKDGDKVELFIQDLTPGPRKYDGQRVRAIISRDAENLPGGKGDTLFFQTLLGRQIGRPWAMKILDKLELKIPGRPYG